MDDKHAQVVPEEKGTNGAPTYTSQDEAEWRETEDFWTRNGLNLKSFTRRPVGDKNVALDKSMKTRHLHMIAIGGSIGAGFFVGSGGALYKGVSIHILTCLCLTLMSNRVQERSSSILSLWVS